MSGYSGRIIRIGSRESRLAVIQAEMLRSYMEENCEHIKAEIVTMKTTGDKILDRRLDSVGGKGLFVKELEAALAEERIDICVHSLKDVPMEVNENLPLIGCSKREDPRDVLVLPQGVTEWDKTLPVGTSSRRRSEQLCKRFPAIRTETVRGNVQTRLRKLDEGEYGALILAAAGLKRLGLEHRISMYFSTEEMLPAGGQGILAIQGRKGEDYSCLEGFFDDKSWREALAERAYLRELDGGCSAPIGAFAKTQGDEILLTGFCENRAGEYVYDSLCGKEPQEVGRNLARKMRG